MAEPKFERGFDPRDQTRGQTVWDRGLLGYIPNRYLRRPLKTARAGVMVPAMLWASRKGGIASLPLPDFLGIGGARCGSTWLHFNLKAHPEISMPDEKELRFWNNNLGRGIKSYSEYFPKQSGCKAGEITPAYGVMDPWRVKLMARVVPDVRLIYLLRNPIDRSWSHLALWGRHRGLAVEDLTHKQIVEGLTSEEFTRNATYSETYRIYSEIFGNEQIYVGFFEDLTTRPKELLAEIFSHIGVSSDIDWDELPLNRRFNSGIGFEHQEEDTSTSMPEVYRRLLANLYQVELRRLAECFGGYAEEWSAGAAEHTRKTS
jgi:hypothetical protein